MTEAKATEENAQEDYEQSMKDSAEKRATDTKTMADKSKAATQSSKPYSSIAKLFVFRCAVNSFL